MSFEEWALPFLSPIMNSTVTLDKAGRVVIPKTLRDELNLEPGDSSAVESEGDSVTLRPLRSASPLRKERGVWVFHGGGRIGAAVTDKVLRDIRAQRERDGRARGQ
jgi:AbrB family looped-hinge helix DNA binding protein